MLPRPTQQLDVYVVMLLVAAICLLVSTGLVYFEKTSFYSGVELEAPPE